MPLTPQQALSRSPEAKLSDEERETFEEYKRAIDHGLETRFEGGHFLINNTKPCSIKVIAYVARAYRLHGWNVTVVPQNGTMGSAQELLAAGAPVSWQVQLIPDWSATV